MKPYYSSTIIMPFGKALRVRREKLRIPQWKVADALGMSQANIAKIESRSDAIADEAHIEILANLYKGTPDDIREGRVPLEWIGYMEEPYSEEDSITAISRRYGVSRRIVVFLLQTAKKASKARDMDDEQLEAITQIAGDMANNQAFMRMMRTLLKVPYHQWSEQLQQLYKITQIVRDMAGESDIDPPYEKQTDNSTDSVDLDLSDGS